MSASAQKQQPEQSSQGLVVFEGFSGLNSQPSRYGIDPTQCYIMDGFFPAGNDFARVIPDNSPIGIQFTASPVYFDFADLANLFTPGVTSPLCMVFLSDGSIYSFNTGIGIPNLVAPPGTIQNPAPGNVAISQWGSQFVLIVSAQVNGYFVYDGSTFYPPGAAVPGFTTVPTGVSGTAIETYQSRVWILNGSSVVFSAPGSLTDFATADGGGSFTSNDPSLRSRYSQLKQSNGYLYLFGDSSTSYLAGVQTTGSPPVTTFSLQVVDPEVGTPWPDTVDVLGSNIVFANAWGAHVSYGGRAAKVSSELDGIYNTVFNFAGQVPSAAKAILFGRRVWVLLLTVLDQTTSQQIGKLFIWDEKRWCSTQQTINFIFIKHQERDSILKAWGTDGVKIYPLFTSPTTNLTKTLRSKFWAPSLLYAETKAENRFWGLIQAFSGATITLTISIDSEKGSSPKAVTLTPFTVIWSNNTSATVVWTNNAAVVVVWTSGGGNGGIIALPPNNCSQNGVLVGFTLSTNAADLAIISLATMPVPVGYLG
jgi:hypothetical protein